LQFRDLASPVHKRSEGNPLFMVNVIDFLLEAGMLVGFAEGSTDGLAEAFPPDHIDIPRNIRQMIERNLEQLRPEEQALLECASVAGMEFSAAAVAAAVHRDTAEIETCCTRLSRHEQFIRMEGAISWPDGTLATCFRFRHTLYQEVLYDRVPAARRLKLHQRIAEREEAALGERPGEIAAQLAHHFSRARNSDKAVEYFRVAAERASARGALLDAERLFTAALAQLDELPESPERDRRELPLQLGIGSALWGGEGWSQPEAERAFTRAQELGERLGESRQLVEVLHGLVAAASSRAQMRASVEFARRMLSLAERNGDHDLLCLANYLMGMTLFWRGELGEAQRRLELATLYSDETDQRPLAVIGRKSTPILASVVALHQGFPDRARLLLDRSLTAESSNNSFHVAFMSPYAALMSITLRDPEALLEHAHALERLSIEQPFFRFHSGYYDEIASLMRGERLSGLPRTQEAKAFWSESEFRLSQVGVFETEALYCASQGLFEDALTKVGEALNEAEEVSLRRAPLLRFRAYLLHKSGAVGGQVESCYCEAIECARKQGNKFDELQSATHFARWLKSQGRSGQARTLLSAIYNWFSEGFDTVALQEAGNLLDQLSIQSRNYSR
jgi:tetratricopeptide (TPR) repeat protein